MWEFVKKIFSKRDGEVTVVVLDDDEPDKSNTFRLHSADAIRLAVLVVVGSVLLTIVIFFVTPLGSLYYQQKDEGLRQDVLSVTERVMALQDSLELRDNQLLDLRRTLVQTPDTLFASEFRAVDAYNEPGVESISFHSFRDLPAYEMLSREEILHSGMERRTPQFPAPFPLDGTVTQDFNVEEGHFGIDIAVRSGTEFSAVADGTVIYAGWTVNYGYVIYLQHGDGFLSVYKHGASLYRKTGDGVLRGDLLGTVGDRGALSFGPHLHLEIWKDGVAQTPQMYLMK